MSSYLTFSNGAALVPTEQDLNMSNSNTRHFLTVLGLNSDYENINPFQVNTLHEALVRFLNSPKLADVEKPVTRDWQPNKATFIDCGRAAGYVESRAEVALEMVVEATSKGATLAYFS